MKTLRDAWTYTVAALRWLPLAALTGVYGGLVGVAFHFAIAWAQGFRTEYRWPVLLLPVGAVAVDLIYRLLRLPPEMGVNRVIEAEYSEDKDVPVALAPAIFAGTALSHLCGASAGREGAALQIGGSLGYSIGRVFRLPAEVRQTMILCGMAAVFSALFGTPVAAVMFVLEVISVGRFRYGEMVPCLTASLVAYLLNLSFGAERMRMTIGYLSGDNALIMLRTAVLSVLCALLSILFCVSVHGAEHLAKKKLENDYVRAVAVGVLLLGMTLLSGGQTYNGAGMEFVEQTVHSGYAPWYAFPVKLLFTAVTLAAGYKGGEIVPTFFVGAAFGAAAGPLLGMDPGLAAAISMIAVFCGVVNCPIASLVMAIEIFGGRYITLFAIACTLSYVFSGYFGLYGSQHILHSKVGKELIDRNTLG
ncbi:MAG: chloride channel protein [Oscillospiraceae bacterium]|nr:chloride channel protein [Oscillospiraceae bacterium]